jgi:hypothetical protein
MTTINANFNKIVIIQSLKDFLTGNRLQDDLNILTIFTDGIVTSELIDVGNKIEFLASLSKIKKDVQEGKYRPIIHIEAHGNEDNSGLMLASKEVITWQEMKISLAGINEATRFNLIICISACYGGSLAKALETNDRSPCWALVGPKEDMYPEDLLKDYTGFYKEIFKTKSGSMALKRLNHSLTGNDAKYYFTTAEWFFELVWLNYLREYCSKENLNKRANEMLKKLRKKNLRYLPSRNEIKNDILGRHPELFAKSKETFFMMDLFQENCDRFIVDYEKILQKAQGAQQNAPADSAEPRR